jgi:cytosine/uracil/thiamine/allantoin permease
MQRAANYCAPAQLVVALLLAGAILYRFGLSGAFITNVEPANAYTTDRITQLAYACEFGLCNALTIVPFMGGLARLVRKPSHLVGPTIVGIALSGASLVAGVGALGAAVTGIADPVDWIMAIVGRLLGSIMLTVILIANIGTMIALVYMGAVAVQQIRRIASRPWPIVVGVILAPGVAVAFNTQWVIDHVMNWLAYNGVMYAGIASVMFVDFFVLRRERVAVAQLFAAHPRQLYWFRGGVNWVAVGVVAGSSALYLWLFDPNTMRVAHPFRYMGATVPTIILSCLAYYVLMRLIALPGNIGGYRPGDELDNDVEVGV